MKRNVYLEGELGEKYGKVREIEANNVAEVFQCLAANFKDFTQYLVELHEKGFDLRCQINNKDIEDIKELNLLNNKGDVTISIIPAGSSKAVKVLAGVALIATGLGAFGTLGTIFGVSLNAVALSVGFSLLASGIAEYLAPDPGSTDINDIKKDAGYLYRGTSQQVLETDPVPVLYGRMRIPGRPISFEVRNKENIITNF